jgi:hypothetical protein
MTKSKGDEERSEVRRVAPGVRTGAKYCGIPELDASQVRTEGQVHTIYYILGLLETPPDRTVQRINSLIAKHGAADIDTCTVQQASSAILELAKEAKDKKNVDVLPAA